jgi:murein L,D-transpeptidase YcbB/YkuD
MNSSWLSHSLQNRETRRGSGRWLGALGVAVTLLFARPAFADDRPNYSPQTYDLTLRAISAYEEIADNGGWQPLPSTAAGLRIGAKGKLAKALRDRLTVTRDLDPTLPTSSEFDQATQDALKHFQARHGLSQTGSVGRLTMIALNVPVEQRLHQLDASANRLAALKFKFGQRYIVSNIPAASLEAVDNGVVDRAYTTVVGSPDRASPTLQTNVIAINILPYWNVPQSILKADIIPKLQRNANYLSENHIRIFRGKQEIDPHTVDWSKAQATDYFAKQDYGVWNSLGFLRIDMPNKDAVYMHDTPHRELFRFDTRFGSSGCTRVAGAQDLAAWVMQGSEWSGQAIQDQIDSGVPKTIKPAKPVPVAWVYLTGWGAPDGSVQFRPDVYSIDTPATPAPTPATDNLTAGTITDRTASVPVSTPAAKARPATAKPLIVKPVTVKPITTRAVTMQPIVIDATATAN